MRNIPILDHFFKFRRVRRPIRNGSGWAAHLAHNDMQNHMQICLSVPSSIAWMHVVSIQNKQKIFPWVLTHALPTISPRTCNKKYKISYKNESKTRIEIHYCNYIYFQYHIQKLVRIFTKKS